MSINYPMNLLKALGKRAKSKARRDAVYLFSTIKRKFMNWLRTRNTIARDNEMLLKVLCYNLTILAKQLIP